MTPQEVEALVGGYHGDPFRILGPHAATGESGQGWEVRAFLPHAETAEVLVNGNVVKMEQKHPQGVFAALIQTDPCPYRLRLKLFGGEVIEQEDPYRFPPLLTDFDLHLHGEGTNFEAYTAFGSHRTVHRSVDGHRDHLAV